MCKCRTNILEVFVMNSKLLCIVELNTCSSSQISCNPLKSILLLSSEYICVLVLKVQFSSDTGALKGISVSLSSL